jgi:hypothetical protein
MKKIIIITISIMLLLNLTACIRKKTAAKNMEQIQKEEGIPVRITEIQP